GAEILVARQEYRAATGLSGKIRGYLPHRWPHWFAPRLVDFADKPMATFARSFPLTAAGDVLLVPTPGHTIGHLAVIVREPERDLFL
ncbi:MBL fold metallo-hydrolase, partial [Streptomyces scabiei]